MPQPRRARALIGSWIAYWALLVAVKLGPAIAAIWHVRGAPDGQASVGVNFGNGGFNLTVAEFGRTTFNGTASLLALALWITGPPLVAWAVWVSRRPRVEAVASPVAG